ncbi:MAG: hypothetical protein IPI60_18795 [Saprospiraceae bacterium]|nr:hypothetical protein [Saprospiraceae bacterium]
MLLFSVNISAQQSRISPWQIHEGTEGSLRFQARSDEQRREAFKKAILPKRDQSGWFSAQTLADGTVQFDRKSVLKDCFEELDFTYFQAIVHVPANVNVNALIVSLDHGDDAARIYIFNSKCPEGYYHPASDLISVDENYKSKVLKSQLVKGEDNRILIVQYDQCPDGNSIKGIRISVNDEEIRPSQIPGTFQLHAYSIHGKE